ncbi:MAG: transglutaminase domain-containing protein [Aristaeellaceae bacterium]
MLWKDILVHGLMAFLFGCGLTLTLLAVLDLMAYALPAVALTLGVTAVCALCGARRWSALTLTGAAAVGIGAWLTVMDGMTTLLDILRAVTLHMTGLHAALPLIGLETALLLAVLCAAVAALLTSRASGGYPALLVLVLVLLLLWLGNRPETMVYLLPAVVAAVTLLIRSQHAGLALRRILPLTAALALAAYFLVPSGGVVIEPLKDAADKLRQTIFDYLFFTEPRNVFTLATEGYYPQGQSQLGGPASPHDDPVMLVTTPKRTYLRAAIKDEYTGRVWVDTLSGRRYLWVSPQWRSERIAAFDALLPEGALGEDSGLMAVQPVTVRMVASSASSMFVPQRIRDLQPGGDLVPYFNASSEVFATRDLQPGDTYTVYAPLVFGGEAGLGTLVTACADGDDAAYATMVQTYTRLPDHLQTELYELAARITADAVTPYDKAYALQTYLSRTYRYALDVEIQPGNVDFVANFLLNTREGYCTYFASAMTVLCRMVGLPARYVEGYLAQPDASGIARVTGLDGHAWTEVYFEGFGWLTFDATPVQQHGNAGEDGQSDSSSDDTPDELPTPPPPEQDDTPDTSEEPTPTPSPLPENDPTPEPSDHPLPPPQDAQNPPPPVWLWLLLLLLAAVIAAAVRILLTQPRHMAARAKDELGRWSVWMQAVSDCLTIMGLSRQPSESPMAHMRRLDMLRRISMPLAPLGECASLVFYGRLDPEPEETAMAMEAYRQLTAGLKWHQAVRLTLLRAFVPMKKRDFTK